MTRHRFTNKRHGELASPPASPSKAIFLDKAARKPRTKLTGEQIKVLEGLFEQDARPDTQERARIAAELGLPSEAVYNWYVLTGLRNTWVGCDEILSVWLLAGSDTSEPRTRERQIACSHER